MVGAADAFAARALKENASDPAGHCWRLAFARQPTEQEQAKRQAFLKAQTDRHAAAVARGNPREVERRALADLCHMLLSANEFAYVD